ncbi:MULTISPECIES: DUF3413 domain-containing protein [unclassified Anaerobiospirillum]|uniref:DUF3413 domain-containing protein n=1 Tax=unclassified Anaerobiospirillum TaxID=2647410 RepID=UPI001FF20F6B|nr:MULTISPECIES: DUF3413 domain-containing protein [unclassified Anaerobiospirillum]MCK0534440.1 DUF3413 domain-containing protein [Anaerobiospirillum sp. NML120511]MCK0539762.1 DUF3413 domain-containing protein [Anaerobiospirillum sp. NML02-A-032]
MDAPFKPNKRFSYKEQVSRSISWGHYFIFLNILLSCFLGTGYVYSAPPAPDFLSFVYLIITCLGHMSFLTVVVFLVIFFPLSFIGNFRWYRVLSVVLAVIWHTLLLFDIKIYLMVKVHLSFTALNLIVRELDFDTGLNYNFLFIAVPLVLAIEAVFAKITTHSLYRAHHPYLVRSVLAVIGVCFISSHVMHIWADAARYERITLLRSTFPVHYPMTAKSFLSSHGWLSEEELSREQSLRSEYIHYPLSPLTIDSSATPRNLIVIAINRFSSSHLTHELTPSLSALEEKAHNFDEHYLLYSDEGDNVFSMNFGLPLQYRSAMISSRLLPVTADEMFRQDYVRRLMVSSGATLGHHGSAATATARSSGAQGSAGAAGSAPGAPGASGSSKDSQLDTYLRELLNNSGLRSPQLSVSGNARDLMINALHQIESYRSSEQRPFAINLVINDLRSSEDASLECSQVRTAGKAAATGAGARAGAAAAGEADAQGDGGADRDDLLSARFDQAVCALPARATEESSGVTADADTQAVITYEHNLRYVDALIGLFMQELNKSGLMDNTMVIITSTEGNDLLRQDTRRYDRQVQHVPLLVFWPDGGKQGRHSEVLSSPVDIFATVASEVVNITTAQGNYTLGAQLRTLSGRDHLLVDGSDYLMLIGRDDTVIYSQDGESYVERHSERVQVRPNLENLIEATRDLNRFLR